MHDVDGGTAKGRVRTYAEAVRLGVIDAPIRDLVDALNVSGVVATQSSCAGHRWPLLAARHTPFVMFRTDARYASALAAVIHEDWRVSDRVLRHYWDVTAQFDDAGELLFTLECRARRFHRRSLGQDFQILRSWVQEIFQSGDVPELVQPDVARRDRDQDQHPHSLIQLAPDGISGAAFGACAFDVGRQLFSAYAARFHRHGSDLAQSIFTG
ncbi:hypothetical protein [Burkholderia cenocepacia]|uniref:hypothetical protein n=1 Tax=Burkholderia cenocepacia TaxID=95486 RepID=UPI002B24B4C5|nr:hypothetical protein [Burkholderia cenocepacia]MEB2558791.1 hypothetical protein [Burkholderia cenocepacia]